jgi:preprotein translocase SecE subunit
MSAQPKTSARGDAAAAANPGKTDKPATTGKKKGGDAPKQSAFSAWIERMRGNLQDTISEMKKITWPDQETTRNLVIVVIGISVFLGILLGGVDYLLVQLLGLF